MKKIYRLSLAAVALFATVACSSVDESMDANSGIQINTIEGVIGEDAGDTRVTATENSDGSIQMLWSASDEIAVTDLTIKSQFDIRDGVGTKVGTFSGNITSTSKNLYAVSPASAAAVSGGSATATIPTVQTYTKSGTADIGDRNIMIGSTTDGHKFTFNTVGAIARFNIKVNDGETINSIKATLPAGGYIAGTGSVDFSDCSLGVVNSATVQLNYAEPEKGVSNGGWALVAPFDFTTLASSAKVYWEVVTNKGTYKFCKKPTKAFRSGMVYTLPLDITKFSVATTNRQLVDGAYMFTSNASTFTAALVAATDTTITVGWSSNGFTDNTADNGDGLHKIYLYDESGKLVVAWRPNTAQSMTADDDIYDATNWPRFTFSGLTPNTIYQVKVEKLDESGNVTNTSNTLAVSTASTECDGVVTTATEAGDVIVFQNFGKLMYGGDGVNSAAGVRYNSYSTLSDIADAMPSGDLSGASQTEWSYAHQSKEQNLFTTYDNLVPSFGMSDWSWYTVAADGGTHAVLARPGYLKLGINKQRGGIVTPKLSALLGNAKIRVSFKAARYGTDQLPVAVVVQEGSVSGYKFAPSKNVGFSTVTLDSESGWNVYSVETSATPSSYINIYGGASDVSTTNNRFYIDDIKVEFLEYTGSVNTDVPVVKQVAATPYAATVEWTEVDSEASTRAYHVAIYKDEACKTLYYEYDTTIAKSSYMTYPARFTFPFLEPATDYYVKVSDSTKEKVSTATRVTTESDERTAPSYEIFYQNFDKACVGGDYMNMANSVKIPSSEINDATSNTSPPTTFAAIQALSEPVSSPTTDGIDLHNLHPDVEALMGLSGYCSDCMLRQGYVKIGTASTIGDYRTPGIYNLKKDGATVTVKFKACPFVDSNSEASTSYIYVNLIDKAWSVSMMGTEAESGHIISSQAVEIGAYNSEPGWKECSVTITGVYRGDKIQFRSGSAAKSRFCLDDISITTTSGYYDATYDDVPHSTVQYADTKTDGTACTKTYAEGVLVTDGYTVVKTNRNGYCRFDKDNGEAVNSKARFIYYTIPADCAVPMSGGHPKFYKTYSASTAAYNFTLTQLGNDYPLDADTGVEHKFYLYAIADPQVQTSTHVSRFKSGAVATIKSSGLVTSSATDGEPKCYGVTLGDIIWNEGSTNVSSLMPTMKAAMAESSIGMPVFHVMGNHDFTCGTVSSHNRQSLFEDNFGPVNYSWDRGNTHIICMRNIIWDSTSDNEQYHEGFTTEQYNWLMDDLANVPKTKMVILCVHAPVWFGKGTSYKGTTSGEYSYFYEVYEALGKYRQSSGGEAHIFSGHTHYNHSNAYTNVHEHVHGAVCGVWWRSKICGDGCPAGYGRYTIQTNRKACTYYDGTPVYNIDANGNTTTTQRTSFMHNVVYKGVHSGMTSDAYQARLYMGDATVGGSQEKFKL